jgi:hypothetical protein
MRSATNPLLAATLKTVIVLCILPFLGTAHAAPPAANDNHPPLAKTDDTCVRALETAKQRARGRLHVVANADLAAPLEPGHAGAPTWFKDFTHVSLDLAFDPHFSIFVNDHARAADPISQFWTEPEELSQDEALRACENMVNFELARTKDSGAPSRVFEIFSLWKSKQIKTSVRLNQSPTTAAQILKDFYLTLIEIRELDSDLSYAVARFTSALAKRVGFEVDPEYASALHSGEPPTLDESELNQELSQTQIEYNRLASKMEQQLKLLQDLETSLKPVYNPIPQIHLFDRATLVSYERQFALKEAWSLVPVAMRQRLGVDRLHWIK